MVAEYTPGGYNVKRDLRRYRVAVRLAAAAIIASLFSALPASASADAMLPPGGQIFAGVSGGYDTGSFERETGQHPAVFQFFSAWGGSTEYMFRGAANARARLMIHL